MRGAAGRGGVTDHRHITFTKTKSSSVQGVVFGCDYDGPDSALLQISVETQFGKSALANDVSALKTVGHPPRPISGVGDEAFSEPDPKGNAGAIGASADASYGAVFGSTYIKVGGLTYVTAAQGKQIVEQLHAKMCSLGTVRCPGRRASADGDQGAVGQVGPHVASLGVRGARHSRGSAGRRRSRGGSSAPRRRR